MVFPYEEFSIDNIYLDSNGNEMPIRDDVKQVSRDMVKVDDNVWKFEIDLPNMNLKQCKDFYVLMARDWTSARHKVIKVKN